MFLFELRLLVILTRSDQTRQLTFRFTAPYSSQMTLFEIQEPVEAKNFSLMPKAKNSFIGRDGLKYHTIRLASLAAGDKFEQSAAYERETHAVSIQNQTGVNASNPSVDRPAS
jgi:hypothetical protein